MPENYDVKTLSYAIARDPVYSIYDNIRSFCKVSEIF